MKQHPHHLAAKLLTVCLLATLLLAQSAVAAPAAQVTSAKLGYTLQVPAGVTSEIQHYAYAKSSQTREIATITGDGTEFVRLDVWDDVVAKDVAHWVRRDFAFLLDHAKWRATRATANHSAAVELDLPMGQTEPQLQLFWHSGHLWCRLTLVASSRPLARAAYALAAKTFAEAHK